MNRELALKKSPVKNSLGLNIESHMSSFSSPLNKEQKGVPLQDMSLNSARNYDIGAPRAHQANKEGAYQQNVPPQKKTKGHAVGFSLDFQNLNFKTSINASSSGKDGPLSNREVNNIPIRKASSKIDFVSQMETASHNCSSSPYFQVVFNSQEGSQTSKNTNGSSKQLNTVLSSSKVKLGEGEEMLSTQRVQTQTQTNSTQWGNDFQFTIIIIYRNVKIKRKIKFDVIHNVKWLIKKLKQELIKFQISLEIQTESVITADEIIGFKQINDDASMGFILNLHDYPLINLKSKTITIQPIIRRNSQMGFQNQSIIPKGGVVDLKVGEITLADFSFIKCIGMGGYSRVHLVRCRRNGHLYAMKLVQKQMIVKKQKFDIIQNEHEVLTKLKPSAFLVKCHACFETRTYVIFVMDVCAGGDLHYLRNKRNRFSEEEAKFLAVQILFGIDFLHRNGIIHRDLKPENIFITEDGHAQLADFGLSKKLDPSNAVADSFCGSLEYLAPEMVSREGHTYSLDYYCFANLIYELVFRCPPFYTNDVEEFQQRLMNQNVSFPTQPEMSREMYHFLQVLLIKNQFKRLGAQDGIAEILSHPWFNGIDFAAMFNFSIPSPVKINMDDCFLSENKYNSTQDIEIHQKLNSPSFVQSETKFSPIFQGFYFDIIRTPSASIPSNLNSKTTMASSQSSTANNNIKQIPNNYLLQHNCAENSTSLNQMSNFLSETSTSNNHIRESSNTHQHSNSNNSASNNHIGSTPTTNPNIYTPANRQLVNYQPNKVDANRTKHDSKPGLGINHKEGIPNSVSNFRSADDSAQTRSVVNKEPNPYSSNNQTIYNTTTGINKKTSSNLINTDRTNIINNNSVAQSYNNRFLSPTSSSSNSNKTKINNLISMASGSPSMENRNTSHPHLFSNSPSHTNYLATHKNQSQANIGSTFRFEALIDDEKRGLGYASKEICDSSKKLKTQQSRKQPHMQGINQKGPAAIDMKIENILAGKSPSSSTTRNMLTETSNGYATSKGNGKFCFDSFLNPKMQPSSRSAKDRLKTYQSQQFSTIANLLTQSIGPNQSVSQLKQKTHGDPKKSTLDGQLYSPKATEQTVFLKNQSKIQSVHRAFGSSDFRTQASSVFDQFMNPSNPLSPQFNNFLSLQTSPIKPNLNQDVLHTSRDNNLTARRDSSSKFIKTEAIKKK